jgi:hypothetical protein
MKSGRCKLCLKETLLCDSHIVPEFLWRDSGQIPPQTHIKIPCVSHPQFTMRNVQDGIKEPLLCEECEGKFSRFETVIKKKLFGAISPEIQRPKGHFIWSGFDYASLKLFQMSILWRMGVSSRPFYSNVQLGKHEEILRKLLNEEVIPEPWRYGCMVTLLSQSEEDHRTLFSQPQKIKLWGQNCYRVAIAGMHWFLFASSSKPKPMAQNLFAQKNGDWVVFQGKPTDFPHLISEMGIQLFQS